jgi:hypothetical protein
MAHAELRDLATVDLGLARELPADPAAAAETRDRAAVLVERYVQDTGLAGLDACLAAADAGEVEGARRAAAQTQASGRMLDAEVARFRSLQRTD